MSNSGFNSGTGSGLGTTGNVTTGPGNSGTGGATGTTGGSTGADFTTGSSGFGTQSGTDSGICPNCGQSTTGKSGLEQLLGRLGINDDMVNNLKGQFQNVDIDEYLNTARTFLKDGGSKAGTYAKDNPGKVAAGVAALALGAGLIYAAVNRDKA
jgi:hypothetical protein